MQMKNSTAAILLLVIGGIIKSLKEAFKFIFNII